MKKLVVGIMVMVLTFGLALMAQAEDAPSGGPHVAGSVGLNVQPPEANRISGLNGSDVRGGDSFNEWFYMEVSSTLRSDFVGCEGYRTRGLVVISDLAVGLPLGFSFYIWNLTGLDRSQSNEIDYYFGWAGQVYGYNLDVGLGYWDINRFLSSDPEKNVDYMNFYVKVSRIFEWRNQTFSPYVKLSWIEPVDTGGQDGFEGGIEPFLGLAHSWETKLFGLSISLESDVHVLHDPGNYGGNAAFIGRFTSQVIWQLTENFAVILPHVDISSPLSEDENRGDEMSLGAGIIVSF